MKRKVVLHQMTAMNVSPQRLPALAMESGCDQITLFTYSPDSGLPEQNSGFTFPVVTATNMNAVKAALASSGVSVNGVEFFPVTAQIDVNDFKGPLALGRELGGLRAVTLIFDQDSSRAADKLGLLCELASAEGLTVGLEFTPLTLGCTSLQQAARFVSQIGSDKLGIGVDTLHLVRSGGSANDLLALDERYFRYCQICDGIGVHRSSDYYEETHNRELPGAGDFPLHDILNALPASIPLEIEVPSEKRWNSGVSSQQHALEAVTRGQAIVDLLQPCR